MIIIPTSTTVHLAPSVARAVGATVVLPLKNKDGLHVFPDGEVYVALPPTAGADRIVILHAGAPHPNEGVVELEQLLAILRDRQQVVELFFTYMPYGMQDSPKNDGELNAAKALLEKLVTYYQVAKIYILDAHFADNSWDAHVPIMYVPAFPLLVQTVRAEYPELVLLSPDAGSARRYSIVGVSKSRTDSHTVNLTDTSDTLAEVRGKDVGMLDDLIETGGTAVRFAEMCRAAGARNVLALITHSVLPSGVTRAKEVYDEYYSTNSIDSADTRIDVSQLIADSLHT